MEMMKTVYNKMKDLRAAYENASDEAEIESLRAQWQEQRELIGSRGEAYAMVFDMYIYAWDKGNEYIDIDSTKRDAMEQLAWMKECGVSKFTFSSTWSSAVEAAWAFCENGCSLEGMVEINAGMNPRDGKKPAYLFCIN